MSSERGHADARQDLLPVRTVRIPQSSSMDLGDSRHKQNPSYHPSEAYSGASHGAPSSFAPPGHRQSFQNYPPNTRPPQRLHSVVTGSFSSFDEERDDFSGRLRGARYATANNTQSPPGHGFPRQDPSFAAEARYPEEGQHVRQGADEQRDGDHGQYGAAANSNAMRIPPSPSKPDVERQDSNEMQPPSFKTPASNLKRSFWHHSNTEDQKAEQMHPAFLPPKRTKIGKSPKGDKIVIPRAPSNDEDRAWYRNNSWSHHDGKDYHHSHQVRKTQSFPAPAPWTGGQPESSQGYRGTASGEPTLLEGDYQNWADSDRQISPSAFRGIPRSFTSQGGQHYHPVNRVDSFGKSGSGEQWRGSYDSNRWAQPNASPRNQSGSSPPWNSMPSPSSQQQYREDAMPSLSYRDSQHRYLSKTDSDVRRQVTFESGAEMDAYHRGGNYSFERPSTYPSSSSSSRAFAPPPQRSPYGQETQPGRFFEEEQTPQPQRDDSVLLLAQPDDRISLSETLCTIRENIEVFTATTADVEAPAPGRKHPVVVGQVGLRCIHCAHVTKSSDKVKRAVCYPSSIKRIYRTVIDMKLDHFQHCRFVPLPLKQRLEELKASNTRSTGTTMQYFVKAATKMGMVDATTGSGVRLVSEEEAKEAKLAEEAQEMEEESSEKQPSVTSSSKAAVTAEAQNTPEERDETAHGSEIDSRPSCDSRDTSNSLSGDSASLMDTAPENEDIPEFRGIVSLALPEDKTALSPLRCFLRQNVCAFSATEEDIAVRTPTTFSVVLGQVGIGCIHCHRLPAKERSNRAVCFPFSIGRIYQSVADIQRFHLNECKMVPPEVRQMFNQLQSASSKGSKGLATRQYWVSSAKKIGLVDTKKGIRFGRDPNVPTAPAVSLDILAQVASNVTTVNRPLVLPEDKDCIAEFLYVVMEQLQPCRFTEADRNKRRLKDVGCIGVECKHCAGQVESRKFFWSSVSAVESNFVSVHTHMMECKMVPEPLKAKLAELKALRKEQTARLKIGSQKAFFARVWNRLHADDSQVPSPPAAKKEAAVKQEEPEQAKAQSPSTIVDNVSDKMAVVSV